MRPRIYANENDKYAAQWLRSLSAAGHLPPMDVDERSIEDVQADDLRGYVQCHFFAGIGGWPLALRMAGWPDERPVWTGSCPCQPFSGAGKQQGEKDKRHLWPEFLRLIMEWDVPTIFGEQVASALGREWLVGVSADLEELDYVVGAADLCAASVGAPHIRQRLFWVADAAIAGRRAQPERPGLANGWPPSEPGRLCGTGRLADATDTRQRRGEDARTGGCDQGALSGRRTGNTRLCESQRSGATGRLADADGRIAGNGRLQPGRQHGQQQEDGRAGGLGDASSAGSGRGAQAVPGAQGKSQRQRFEHGRVPDQLVDAAAADGLAYHHHQGLAFGSVPHDGPGIVRREGPTAGADGADGRNFWSDYYTIACSDGKTRRSGSGIQPLAHGVPNRVGRLRAYGNAISPQVAVEFIKAYEEARSTAY